MEVKYEAPVGTNWAKYRKKYKKEWELIPEFQHWISESSYGELYAFCRACKRHIRAHRHDLQKHYKTTKHKRNFEAATEILALEEEEDEEGNLEDIEDSFDNIQKYVLQVVDKEDNLVEIKPKFEPEHEGFVDRSPFKNNVQMVGVSAATRLKEETGFTLNNENSFPAEHEPNIFSSTQYIDKDIAAFAHYVAVELQSVKNDYARHLAKIKINGILFEVCTGQYNHFQGSNHKQ